MKIQSLPVVVCALLLSVTHLLRAQYSAVKLVPKGVAASEFAGATRQSVAVSPAYIAMGSTLAMNPKTVPANQLTGAVYLWDAVTGKQLPTLYPPASHANSGMGFGSSVAIAGRHLVVGAPNADDVPANLADDRGAVFVFDVTTLKLIQTIQLPSFLPLQKWGRAVAMDREDVVIGAPDANTYGIEAGNCVVFHLKTATSNSIAPGAGFTALLANDRFGTAVAIRNGIIAVGAPFSKVGIDSSAGRVYLFNAAIPDSAIVEIPNPDRARLPAQSGADDVFGFAINFAGRDELIIGAPNDDSGVTLDAGSASVFDIANVIAPSLIFTDYGYSANDHLGSSVAGKSSRYHYGMPGRSAAAGAITSRSSDYFEPSVLNAGDSMGTALAYAEGLLVASAPYDDSGAVDSGALWLFRGLYAQSLYFSAQPMVLNGDTAQGFAGLNFATFTTFTVPQNDISLNVPSFLAKVTGTGSINGQVQGIWDSDSYGRPSRAVLTGGFDSLVANSITNMVTNVGGNTWFKAKRLVGGKTLIARSSGGLVNTLITEGDILVGGTIAKLGDGKADNVTATPTYAYPVTYKIGTGAPVTTAATDSAVRLSVGLEAREGDATGFGGYTNGQMPTRMSLAGGRLTYTQAITGLPPLVTPANNSVVVMNGARILQRGDPVPDVLPAASFGTFLGETVRGDGAHMLVRATLNPGPGVSAANNEILWSDRAVAGHLIFRKGQSAPQLAATVVVKKFLSYSIGAFGDITCLVQVGGPGITTANDVVLYYIRNTLADPPADSAFDILAQEGDHLSGNDGAKIATIAAVDYTTRTDVMGTSYYGVLVTLVAEKGGATTANNLAWLVGNTAPGAPTEKHLRLPRVHLRKGVTADSGGSKRSISSFALPLKLTDTSGAGNSGLPHAVSAGSGYSSLIATYLDKSTAVIVMRKPLE